MRCIHEIVYQYLAGYSLDGPEKVTRPMCALPKSKVAAGQVPKTKLLNIYIIQCCPETPVLEGKSKLRTIGDRCQHRNPTLARSLRLFRMAPPMVI